MEKIQTPERVAEAQGSCKGTNCLRRGSYIEGFECQVRKSVLYLMSREELDEHCIFRKVSDPELAGGNMGLR